MSKQTFQPIRGMKDIAAPESKNFEQLLSTIKKVISSYGYEPFHPPILENTSLFSRSVGEATDVVEKEMFSFNDEGDSLTMRPEATAGIVRAVVQNGMTFGTHKLWTAGPMFRRERPQRGRYRQFTQVSVECFGIAEPELDAEQIIMLQALWEALGIQDSLRLEINTLASSEIRAKYRQALITYFEANFEHLDEDSQRRLHKNPLRILDSKNPKMQLLNNGAPKLSEYLDEASDNHFKRVLELLDLAKIKYNINPFLVRGLDYYNHTVFEWVTDKLGSQGTVCGGGRYDGLTEHIGGKYTPGIGFAIGVDRLLLLQEELDLLPDFSNETLAYLVLVGNNAKSKGLLIAKELRKKYINKVIICNLQDIKLKAQIKKADKIGAKYAIIIGDEEIQDGKAVIKNLSDGNQIKQSFDKIIDYFTV